MSPEKVQPKLAVILCAEIIGYDRLNKDDADRTGATIARYHDMVERRLAARGGAVIRKAADEMVMRFASAVDALRTAVAIQADLTESNAALPSHRRLHVRMGADLGEVSEAGDGGLAGPPLAVATRLMSFSADEAICVSEALVAQSRRDLYLTFEFLTALSIAGIDRPVNVYRITTGIARPATPGAHASRRMSAVGFGAIAAVMTLLAAAGVWLWWTQQGAVNVTAPAPALDQQTNEHADADDPVFAMPSGPSIAVLPFVNHSGDPDQAYFASGLAVDITTRLSRYPELRVITGRAGSQFDTPLAIDRNMASQIGARFLLEGGVRKSRDDVRVTVTLVDGTSGETLWGETYERALTAANLFAVQDDITERVVAVVADVHGMIRKVQLEESLKRYVDNLAAFDCVLRANAYYHVLTEDEHGRARDCLEQAIQDEPDYVEAWSLLASIYVDEHSLGFNPRADSLTRAVDAARKAVSLDPNSQLGHYMLAHAYFIRREMNAFRTSSARIEAQSEQYRCLGKCWHGARL